MEENQKLRQRMAEAGFTQTGLAETVNAYLRSAGYEGTVSERTVRYWLTGRTRCPYPRQREALEAVFECAAVDLGFTSPRGRRRNPATPPEDPVQRRNFLTAATGTTTAAAIPFATARPSVGTSDVLRLRSGLDALPAVDQQQGGHGALERKAMVGADETLQLLKRGTATQRIRQRLYGVAAGYMSSAAWSAIDDHCLDRAQRHLEQALYLAGMANDATAELQVWNLYGFLGGQRKHHVMTVDASKAAQATAVVRRDPIFASLTHARAAVGHAHLGDHQAARRSLGYAQEALAKADPTAPRPTWTVFYGAGELMHISEIVLDQLGDPAAAETAGHQALAAFPAPFRRNRAMATASLALAQLHQGDAEQACATAGRVFELTAGQHIPGRLRSRLGEYHRDLITLAPDSPATRDWSDRYRSERNPA